MRALAEALMPGEVRRWVRAQQRRHRIQWPRAGTVQFGNLRRLTPISRIFGFERGLPIDRYYIGQFLSAHSRDIRGHVLEIGDDSYTRRFGGDRVTKTDVLHVAAGNPKATIVADLTCADRVPSETFDSIILIQTLQMIYDVRAALRHLHRILKPGGVLLVTTHGLSKISRREGVDPWGEYWRLTCDSAHRLFREAFPAENVRLRVYGNVFAATAFLYGLAAEDLREEELDHCDPDYEVLITVRAVKAEARR
jgi:SAM-dependent methyltransferase